MAKDNFNSPDYYAIDKLFSEENILIRNITREWVKTNVSPIIENAVQNDEFPFDFVRLFTNPSFENWGEAVDGWYDNVRGSAESNKVRDTYDCNGSTLFTGRIVR